MSETPAEGWFPHIAASLLDLGQRVDDNHETVIRMLGDLGAKVDRLLDNRLADIETRLRALEDAR